MFCPNCGSQIEDGSAFCGNCGSALNTAEQQPAASQPVCPSTNPQPQYQPQYQYQPAAPGSAPAPAPKKSNKKLIGILIAVAVVVVAVVVLLVVLLGGSGRSPEDIAERFVDSLYSGDFDEAMDCVHKNFRSELGEAEEAAAEILSLIEVDHVKAVGSEQLSKSELEDLIDDLSYTTDKVPNITEAYAVDVEIEASFLGQTETETFTVYVGEVDGDYYVVNFDD